MPLTHFICPDGKTREIKTCLEKCPVETGRCLSLPTLMEIGRDRKFHGEFSTTQLLNPTRMEYLKITKNYAINPFDKAFALLGTRHHQKLEATAKLVAELKAEQKLKGEIATGILDLLEPNTEPNTWRLIDYKTWGAYQVAKITGVKTNGDYEIRQVTLQLNNYKIMIEDLGFKVNRLFVQCTVRDGGTFSARNSKIDYKIKLIPIEILPVDVVKEYFSNKASALQSALDNNKLPELCEFNERWKGRRCKGFCETSSFCPEGAKINKVNLQE